MVVAGTVGTLFRLPNDARNLLWAEDGKTFLADAFTHGLLTNLFTPYAGYMHLVPRTAAELTSLFVPVDYLGLGMNIFGAATWSLVALAAFVFTRERLQLPMRWLLWVLVLVLPIGSQEVATNTANSHWFLMFGLFVALISRSGSWSRAVFASVLVSASVLSDPLSLMFFPLVLVRAFSLRGLREQVPGIAFVGSAVVQLIVVLNTTREAAVPGYDPDLLSQFYLVRVVWGDLLGPTTGGASLYQSLGVVAVLFITGAFMACLTAAIAIRWRKTALAAASLIFSVGSFGVISALTWSKVGVLVPGYEVSLGGRYLVVPSLLLALSLVSIMSAWVPTREEASARWMRPVIFAVSSALLLTPGLVEYQDPSYKAGYSSAVVSIENASETCELDPKGFAVVPIAPAKWTMSIPCADILEAR
ncbi:hypothetical protein [Agreia pratensis]|uniref:Uncharacterized protein n=1 Tax=Agreia pratensis TaxID=150121 RepID=A0A1X7IDD3_9MICO|nr:hypothetical protein [Agreia pratensis]SMG12318.1 hypothetical protein SAMN06296010_0370 [Agreia pratensis]